MLPSSQFVKRSFVKMNSEMNELEEHVDVYAVDRAQPAVEREHWIPERPL